MGEPELIGIVTGVDPEQGRASLVLLSDLKDGEQVRVVRGKGTYAFRATQLRYRGYDPVRWAVRGMAISFSAPAHLQEGDRVVRADHWVLGMMPMLPEPLAALLRGETKPGDLLSRRRHRRGADA